MLTSLGAFAGGIGLFLLGMRLMTDGLKTAAGEALRRILGQWTRTPLRGVFSGFLITALVQSSSAVTVATIGFVNAGLLTLSQSIGVIYGSNIGTTVTGWLVVLIGFKIDIQAFALPLIGVGTLLDLAARGRSRALGQTLVGFGLFFLGVALLKGSFEGLGNSLRMEELAHNGILGMLLFATIGALLTLLMQSSSAAFALVLSATASGLIPLSAAAACVVGANVGTTSTAGFAVIGATPNARRVAAAHVAFNALTGAVALLLLPVLLATLQSTALELGREYGPATLLALFHTAFNLLGVLLLWPLTPYLVRWLETHFRSAEEDATRPKYLDQNVAATPRLAVDALTLELDRIGTIAWNMARSALSTEAAVGPRMAGDLHTVKALVEAVEEFAVRLQKATLPAGIADALPDLLRIARYYEGVAEMAVQVAQTQPRREPLSDPLLSGTAAQFRNYGVRLLHAAVPGRRDDPSVEVEVETTLKAAQEEYQRLKAQLLRAGAEDRIRVRQMVALLDEHSVIRRMLEQAAKGARYLAAVRSLAAQYGDGQEAQTPVTTAVE